MTWRWVLAGVVLLATGAQAEILPRVVDLPTRAGVTQRFVYLAPPNPRASVVLFAGGNGELRITPDGVFKSGKGNFLVRTRQMFADRGLAVIVVDAPSDRQEAPFLSGFRQRREHVDDIKAVIAWARQQNPLPVWLIGTSRGTQSAAYVTATLSTEGGGPDGLVLTSTILDDPKGRPVPAMDLGAIRVPVLVLHHAQDGCRLCAPDLLPGLMDKLGGVSRKALIMVSGGQSEGDPCEARAYHGYNGIEREVVDRIADWILAPP